MLKHRRRGHYALLYECEECGKKSKTRTDHERHSRIHERKSVLKPLNVLKKSQRYVRIKKEVQKMKSLIAGKLQHV